MKKFISPILNNPLLTGSALIFLGSNFGNVFNLLNTIYLTNHLTLSDYGTVASLISVTMLFTLPAGAAVPMLVNFAATYFAKNELSAVRGLFNQSTKILAVIGIVILLLFSIFSGFLAAFFQIQNTNLLVISGLCICIIYIGVINGALLQAKLAFNYVSFINFLGASVKFGLAVLFVSLGFAATGVMWAYFLSFLLPYLFTFIPLREVFKKHVKDVKTSTGQLFTYGAPASIALFSLTALTTTDLMVVKHFFNPNEAGVYAVLTVVGKVIFFLTAPIANVMFPIIVQKYTKAENYHKDFYLSLLMIAVPSVSVTLIYFFMPEISITFFNKQKEALTAAPFLGLYGIFISVYSILYIMTNFFLSINKTKISFPIAAAALLQLFLLWLFHETFQIVISISLSLSIVLLGVLLLYYLRLHGKKTF
jgi:O-antigen/teichoic acid export membrane protein